MRTLVLALLMLVGMPALAQPTPASSPDERLFAAISAGKELVAEGLVRRREANANARDADGETGPDRLAAGDAIWLDAVAGELETLLSEITFSFTPNSGVRMSSSLPVLSTGSPSPPRQSFS